MYKRQVLTFLRNHLDLLDHYLQGHNLKVQISPVKEVLEVLVLYLLHQRLVEVTKAVVVNIRCCHLPIQVFNLASDLRDHLPMSVLKVNHLAMEVAEVVVVLSLIRI